MKTFPLRSSRFHSLHVLLHAKTNRLADLRPLVPRVLAAVESALPGRVGGGAGERAGRSRRRGLLAGQVAAEDLTYAIITPSHPAQRGAVVSLFANGLGPVTKKRLLRRFGSLEGIRQAPEAEWGLPKAVAARLREMLRVSGAGL